jgi:hypothetical protein
LKTIYTLMAGAVAVFFPAPGLAGRWRLPRRTDDQRPAPEPIAADGPIVLFLPAYDEEARVASVIDRVPATISGHPVQCVVIDDGSTDTTARVAEEAGASVISLPTNRGLGAAVRLGLHIATEREAVVVAFCDADGEYDPDELEHLVAPVLSGDADYVVGSRFEGTITSMRPHRRFGNRVLTRILRFVARAPITDGQSGYRALSARAAREAEIIPAYNYAQVLTLDLLGKGYRYTEVPISYQFRSAGRSFVKLGRYLAAVGPAVHRELNASEPSVLDHVTGEAVAGSQPTLVVEAAVRPQRVGGRPAHREHMVRVVLDEQPLTTEDEQPILR